MGMYTQLHYAAELRKDVPDEVVAVLAFMVGEDEEPAELPDHAFFQTSRWRWLFTMDSYYFDADTHSTLRFDSIAGAWYLTVLSNIKNYDDEIEAFIDWLDPYTEKGEGDFLGFWRYEEDEQPTLIHKLAAGLPVKEGDDRP